MNTKKFSLVVSATYFIHLAFSIVSLFIFNELTDFDILIAQVIYFGPLMLIALLFGIKSIKNQLHNRINGLLVIASALIYFGVKAALIFILL